MDKSPHYIKMCESVKVIQKQWKHKLIDTNPGLGAKLLKGMPLTVSDRLRKSFDRITVFF